MKSKYIHYVLIFRHFALKFHMIYAIMPAEHMLFQSIALFLKVLEDRIFLKRV